MGTFAMSFSLATSKVGIAVKWSHRVGGLSIKERTCGEMLTFCCLPRCWEGCPKV